MTNSFRDSASLTLQTSLFSSPLFWPNIDPTRRYINWIMMVCATTLREIMEPWTNHTIMSRLWREMVRFFPEVFSLKDANLHSFRLPNWHNRIGCSIRSIWSICSLSKLNNAKSSHWSMNRVIDTFFNQKDQNASGNIIWDPYAHNHPTCICNEVNGISMCIRRSIRMAWSSRQKLFPLILHSGVRRWTFA